MTDRHPGAAGADPTSTDPTPTDPRWKLTPTKYLVTGILLVGIVVPLLVSTYDIDEPRLFGFPFFYWYQLAWVFLAAGLCWLSFVLLQRERAAWARWHGGDGMAQVPGPGEGDPRKLPDAEDPR